MNQRGWLDDARQVSLASVVEALGDITVRRASFGPCPACNEQYRDGRRPACGSRGNTWKCWKCGVDGGPIHLVYWRLNGSEPGPGAPGWPAVREWFASKGWCNPARGQRPPPRPSDRLWLPRESGKQRPPREEVAAFLRGCREPGVADAQVQEWLRSRGYVPADVPAGVTPLQAPWWPRWWPYERDDFPERHGPDTRGVYRLVVPAFEPSGELASVHARAVIGKEAMIARGLVRRKRDGTIEEEKTRWPAGVSSGGLLFADLRARAVLRGQRGIDRVVVCEGITDYIAAAAAYRHHEATAVVGAVEGGWEALGRARWPAATRFFVATDPDGPGERFAALVAETLSEFSCYRVPLAELARRAA